MAEPKMLIQGDQTAVAEFIHAENRRLFENAVPSDRLAALRHWLRAGEVYFRDATTAEAELLAYELDRLWRARAQHSALLAGLADTPGPLLPRLELAEALRAQRSTEAEIAAALPRIVVCTFCGQPVRGGHCGCV